MIQTRIRKIPFIVLLLILLAPMACAQKTYRVTGKVMGQDGQTVYLTDMEKNAFDSTTVVNQAFVLEGPLEKVQIAVIKLGNKTQPLLLGERPVIANFETRMVEVKGKNLSLSEWKISGDEDQELLRKMNMALAQEMLAMMGLAFAGDSATVEQRDTLGMLYIESKANSQRIFEDSIVAGHPDSYVAAIVLDQYLSKQWPVERLDSAMQTLSDRVRLSNLGENLAQTVAKLSAVTLGNTAPDFSLPTPEGRMVSLSSFRGKCLLIDFWASWCGPCLREIPNIKRVYEKYHDQGFEVLSISLDDKEANWLNAVKKHAMPWTQVSSLKGWKCPVAQLYGVSAVPAMVLIDRDGRIVSTNARGEKLDAAVSEICK